MADRWLVLVDSQDQVTLEHNNAWYTGADSVNDAVAIAKNQRAKTVTVEYADGYVEVRR